jgi:hypothetical protein
MIYAFDHDKERKNEHIAEKSDYPQSRKPSHRTPGSKFLSFEDGGPSRRLDQNKFHESNKDGQIIYCTDRDEANRGSASVVHENMLIEQQSTGLLDTRRGFTHEDLPIRNEPGFTLNDKEKNFDMAEGQTARTRNASGQTVKGGEELAKLARRPEHPKKDHPGFALMTSELRSDQQKAKDQFNTKKGYLFEKLYYYL